MHPDPIRQAVQHGRELIAGHQYNVALALLDDLEAPPARAAEVDLVRVSALAGLERFGTCFQIVNALLARDELAPRDLAEARFLDARLLRKASPVVDGGIRAAFAAVAAATRLGEAGRALAAEALCEAAYLFAQKRCRRLAAAQLERAAELLPEDARVRAAQGWVCVDFDERADAGKHFHAAAELAPDGARLGRLGLAHVATLVGEFAEAHEHLDAIGPVAGDDLMVRRARARLLAAEHRWQEVADCLGEIAGVSPHGDYVRVDAYQRALASYRAGNVARALGGFAQVHDGSDERGGLAQRARRMIRMLERPGASDLPRRRLAAFPSVAQLRDHCGPATCELYLRFYGIDAEQVEIARRIKVAGGGTPVYRMRRFLEAAGLHARRVEADLGRVRQLLGAGIPVIMEEDYSDTRHVTIAIGYDDAREILEVQDPMTHEIRETLYEELPRLRSLSNHGALVAVPPGDRTRLAALDAMGATECRYIALVDGAWAAHDEQRVEEADRLCAEALELRRDYELGWFYRFRRARQLATEAPTVEHKVELHRVLGEITSLWPDDEWPQQLAGEVLYVEGRYHEALAACETARDRDPADAHNWSLIADCHMCLGHHDEAFRALERALELDPGHIRANENAAYLALGRQERELAAILGDAALELAPGNAFNHLTCARRRTASGDFAGALTALDEAYRLDPQRDEVVVERAKTLAQLGRVDEAAAFLGTRIAERPDDTVLRIELADLYHGHARHREAAEVARALVALAPELPSGHALLGAALAAQGDLEAGFAAMRQALALRPTYAWVHTEMGRALVAAGRPMDAVPELAAALGLSRASAGCEYDLGMALAAAGHPDEAIGYLWSAGTAGQLDEAQLGRVGELLVENEHDADSFFREIEKRRDELPVLRAHARTLLEVLWAPGAARSVLERIRELAPDDVYARAALGADLMDRALPSEAEGEALLLRAIADAPAIEYPRRVLGERLVERGRAAEALDVLAPCHGAYTVESHRVRALLLLDRLDDVAERILAFRARYDDPQESRPCVGALMLEYRVARRRWDWRRALELAEVISRENNERDDDGRLDHWEQEKFECLCRLGEAERALRFGERQAVDAPSLGRLAGEALGAEQDALARELARRALRLGPDEPQALHVSARLAELDGSATRALNLWERAGELDPESHVPHENIARVLLGTGDDARRAGSAADLAVSKGHGCAWAFGVRAQVRLCAGEREGAVSDVTRAWALALPEEREHELGDVWALRALLGGDAAGAARAFDAYLGAGLPLSAADRARVARVRAHG